MSSHYYSYICILHCKTLSPSGMLFEIMMLQHEPEYQPGRLGHSLVRIPFSSHLSKNILNFFFTFPAFIPSCHPSQMLEYFILSYFKLLRLCISPFFLYVPVGSLPSWFFWTDFFLFCSNEAGVRYFYMRDFLAICTMVYQIGGSFPCLCLLWL